MTAASAVTTPRCRICERAPCGCEECAHAGVPIPPVRMPTRAELDALDLTAAPWWVRSRMSIYRSNAAIYDLVSFDAERAERFPCRCDEGGSCARCALAAQADRARADFDLSYERAAYVVAEWGGPRNAEAAE